MSRLAAALLFLLVACSDKNGVDGGATCAADGGGAFGATCTSPCDCASAVCFQFGDGNQACTLTCTSNDQCPSGSQGKKCNGQGYCRP